MAGENTLSTMNGFFKDVFAPKLIKAVPDFAKLQSMVAFSEAEKIGELYSQPVALTHENGFTYTGESGTLTQLKDAANGVIKEAQVKGSAMTLRTRLGEIVIDRATKSEKSFERTLAFKVFDMQSSAKKRVEIAMLYGQSGVGTVESVTANGSDADIVITEGTWAGGIWAGAEGARLDAFTGTTKNNASGVLTILKVDSDARKLTVSFTGTLGSEVAANDVLYFESTNAGSGSFNEMAGLQKIISNTTTLFGIDAASYSLWKGTTISTAGPLTPAKLNEWVAKAVNKGLMEKCVVLLSPKGWGALNTDFQALRMLDSSYTAKKGSSGHNSLELVSQNGVLEFTAHPFVKDGDCFILPLSAMQRVGSLDVTFGLAGGDDKFFMWVPDYNAVELRCRTDQAIFLDRPAQAVYVSGITY